MKPILEIITESTVTDLASRSNLRFGKTLLKNEHVKIVKQNTFNIDGKVQHSKSQEYDTWLGSTSKGLRWKCSCTSKKEYFCEHCVALSLKLIDTFES